MIYRFATITAVLFSLPLQLAAQDTTLTRPYSAAECPSCAEWNLPQQPMRIFGNTYYVGTHGLSAVLVTSSKGHILIDGGLPNSAPLILENIRSLGFRPSDVKVMLNSHAHYDHAGGFAALQQVTGARVVASASSARVIADGKPGHDDPQHEVALPMPPVRNVKTIGQDGVVRVDSLALTAHATGGHTPGGTTWTWRSCEADQCVDVVYADSQTPISADGFLFSNNKFYADAVADFQRGHTLLEQLPCDVLITPHPGASSLFDRMKSGPSKIVDSDACKRYAANARRQLQQRLDRESR